MSHPPVKPPHPRESIVPYLLDQLLHRLSSYHATLQARLRRKLHLDVGSRRRRSGGAKQLSILSDGIQFSDSACRCSATDYANRPTATHRMEGDGKIFRHSQLNYDWTRDNKRLSRRTVDMVANPRHYHPSLAYLDHRRSSCEVLGRRLLDPGKGWTVIACVVLGWTKSQFSIGTAIRCGVRFLSADLLCTFMQIAC